MTKKIITALVSISALLLLASCLHDYETGIMHEYQPTNHADALSARDQLLEMGWSEEELDSIAEGSVSLENILNQARFGGFAQYILNNQPIGPSGEVISAAYFGGIRFDDNGVLVVSVLDAAVSDSASATAIEEMRELGLIIEVVTFTYAELVAAIDALNGMPESVRTVGATSWGLSGRNRVEIWLDPYTPEQKAIFNRFLQDNGLNPAMFTISQAVTPEMVEHRAAFITRAVAYPRNRIVHIGEVEVTRTGIAFSMQNLTDMEFNYGAHWDLAYYTGGNWAPMPHPPGTGGMPWPAIGFSLQGGGIQQYRQEWEWLFDQLSPGRYMFIRSGWQGQWSDGDNTYAVVEFTVTEDSPESLPPEPDNYVWPDIIEVGYSEITPYGMTLLIENISGYDIEHRAQILFIVPEEHVTSDYWWDWQQYHIPFLPLGDYWTDHVIQGEGPLPVGGQLEFTLNWENLFGPLPPGEYVIALSLGGQAGPPHPTGFASNDTVLISFII